MLDIASKLTSLVKNFKFLSKLQIASNNDNRQINLHIHIPENGKISKRQLELAREQLIPILKENKPFKTLSEPVDKSLKVIDDYNEEGNDPNLKKFINDNLPEKDKAIWYSSLILRKYFEEDKKELVSQLKSQIISTELDRGKNIANLCSAGYLESLIIPLNSYFEDEKIDKQLFLEIYETIVTEYPFAVFVSQYRPYTEIKKEIIDKINKVKKYGWKKVSVHGIGKENVKEIKKLAEEIETSCKVVNSVDVNTHGSKGIIITFTFNLS